MSSITNISFLLIFIWGFYGLIINRNNLIQIIISLEIIILSLVLNLSTLIYYSNTLKGVILFFLIVVIAASETALGLTLVVSLNKLRGTISTLSLNLVK